MSDDTTEVTIGTKATIFSLIFIFPVGLLLMWTCAKWKKPVKIAVTAFFALILAANLFAPDKVDETMFTAPYEGSAYIDNSDIENPVWITLGGSKYHGEGCYVLDESSRAIPLEEAVAKGMEPCSKCSGQTVEEVPETIDIVWVTNSGKKYHREDCSSLRGNGTQITLSDAQLRGLEPCKLCKP